MKYAIALMAACTMAAAFVTTTAARQPSRASASGPATERHKAVLQQYCVSCHSARIQTAGLALDRLDIDNVPAHAETWEKVVRKLRTGAMPPPGLPRPDEATYKSLASGL